MLEKYCGVDLVSYLGHKKDHQGIPLYMIWVIPIMCLVLSPYTATQGLLWASEVGRGERSDRDKAFSWYKVRLNIPGDPNYPPKTPLNLNVLRGN